MVACPPHHISRRREGRPEAGAPSPARRPPGKTMALQIWSKAEEKFGHILVLQGTEVHLLKVTGMSLTFKRKFQGVLDALQQGQAPAEAGGKLVGTLDARSIGKAEVSPTNSQLTLHGQGEGAPRLKFPTGNSDADA